MIFVNVKCIVHCRHDIDIYYIELTSIFMKHDSINRNCDLYCLA